MGSDKPRPPRRKRVNGSSSHCGAMNGSTMNDDGSYAPKSSTNGRARERRRELRDLRRKKSKLGKHSIVGCCIVGFILVVFIWDASPSDKPYAPQSASSSPPIDPASAKGNSLTVNSEKRIARILGEIPNNSPLTEKQEQEILHAAYDELNQFPISVGSDDSGSNPNWETIEHPGDEALKAFRGVKLERKKRATASDLAGILAGKKLRGANDINNDMKENDIEEGYMRVPKFWDPLPYKTIADERERRGGDGKDLPRDGVRRYLGNFGSRLMTPAEAKSIGSRIPSNGELLETIFVAIASYRDWQCSGTVESALSRASHPERVRIAVVDQIRVGKDAPCSVPPDGPCDQHPDQYTCKYQSQVDYLTVEADLSVGPVFARHLGHRLYRGEYFAMQSDAHVSFVKNWDDEIIAQWHSAKNKMAILSTYLSGTEGHIDLKTGKRLTKSRPIMCVSDWEGRGEYKHLRHGQQPEGVPFIHDIPTLNPFWAAGFSFGRGHFVVNVPYDQHLPWIFQGEEISIGLRGFSYGYDYYSPEKSVCYHFYGRKNVPMFWENSSLYRGAGDYGMNRLNAIIDMLPNKNSDTIQWLRKDELKYGLGKVRPTHRFFEIFGIHVESQTVEQHLCRFVGRPMQKEFLPSLRSNEMGLDYDKITYRFVDPDKNH